MKTHYLKTVLILALLLLQSCILEKSTQSMASQDWPSFGRDFTSQRFAPATQINTTNVNQLVEAWKVNTGVTGSDKYITPSCTIGVV